MLQSTRLNPEITSLVARIEGFYSRWQVDAKIKLMKPFAIFHCLVSRAFSLSFLHPIGLQATNAPLLSSEYLFMTLY